MGGTNQIIPVLVDVLRRSTNTRHRAGHVFCLDHFDCVPGADRQLVGVGLFLRNVDTHLAADAAFQIDLAPTLHRTKLRILLNLDNAIDRANFEARFAPGAIIGVDDRKGLRQFLAWGFFLCHKLKPGRISDGIDELSGTQL